MQLHAKNGVPKCLKNLMCIPTNMFYAGYSQSWYGIIFAMDSVDLKMSYNVSLSLLRKHNDI